MFISNDNEGPVQSTNHRVVLPFYFYAAIAFLVATLLLLFSTVSFTQHYFQPSILAITHTMALGWGTMIILGASHQLVPVLIEGRLYSNTLAYASFVLAALGIPLLVYGFYTFNMGWPSQWGGILINAAVLAYLVNLALSMVKSKKENVHAAFIFTAALWLLLTTLMGLALVCNFTETIIANSSLYFLPLHAHLGMAGWFLLLIIGVGSRLVPMFLISKYTNTKLLWIIYTLINTGLLVFIIGFMYFQETLFYAIPAVFVLFAILLFGYYCYQSFRQRIRKQADEQMKISLLSVVMMLLPLILLILIICRMLVGMVDTKLVLVYGFVIFFGWITTMIFGMTFKTLPFIVWNKVYHLQAGLGKTPNPKDLFSSRIFGVMVIAYLLGFVLFIIGIYKAENKILKTATVFLLFSALLYNWNVIKLLLHKRVKQ